MTFCIAFYVSLYLIKLKTFNEYASSNDGRGGEKVDQLTITTIQADNHKQIIDELMVNYGQDVLQLVYAYVHNEAMAEDLTQEIFLKCYQSLHTYKGKSSMKTWLRRIAINHAKDYLKSWYNQRVLATNADIINGYVSQENVEQIIIQQSEDELLATAVMQLPINYREVIYLFYYEELTLKDIGNVLDLNVNTVKTRLRKGKGLLKEIMEGSTWMND